MLTTMAISAMSSSWRSNPPRHLVLAKRASEHSDGKGGLHMSKGFLKSFPDLANARRPLHAMAVALHPRRALVLQSY